MSSRVMNTCWPLKQQFKVNEVCFFSSLLRRPDWYHSRVCVVKTVFPQIVTGHYLPQLQKVLGLYVKQACIRDQPLFQMTPSVWEVLHVASLTLFKGNKIHLPAAKSYQSNMFVSSVQKLRGKKGKTCFYFLWSFRTYNPSPPRNYNYNYDMGVSSEHTPGHITSCLKPLSEASQLFLTLFWCWKLFLDQFDLCGVFFSDSESCVFPVKFSWRAAG